VYSTAPENDDLEEFIADCAKEAPDFPAMGRGCIAVPHFCAQARIEGYLT
jgi:hypothetical protein